MNIYHSCYYSLLAVAGVLGLATAGRKGSLSLRLLAWLPLITLPVELLALWVGHHYHRNHWVYNCWLPLECGCLLLVLYAGSGHPVTKRLNGWLLALLPIGTVAAYFANPSITYINLPAMLFYLFCELLAGFIFLTDCLLSSEDASIFSHPLSWTAGGIILYACVFILTHATWLFTVSVSPTWYGYLVLLGNTFLYGGMILTFIQLRRK